VKISAQGSICGEGMKCASLSLDVAGSVAGIAAATHGATNAPTPSLSYLILLRAPSRPDLAALLWVPGGARIGRIAALPQPARLVWYSVPPTLASQLRHVTARLAASPAPKSWRLTDSAPWPPKSVISSWVSADKMPQSDALGATLFYESGCLNCHRYRKAGGTEIDAPALTHIGRRLSQGQIERVLKCPACVQKGSAMPSFATLPRRELDALSAFLAASR
jgi:hypothetical protein